MSPISQSQHLLFHSSTAEHSSSHISELAPSDLFFSLSLDSSNLAFILTPHLMFWVAVLVFYASHSSVHSPTSSSGPSYIPATLHNNNAAVLWHCKSFSLMLGSNTSLSLLNLANTAKQHFLTLWTCSFHVIPSSNNTPRHFTVLLLTIFWPSILISIFSKSCALCLLLKSNNCIIELCLPTPN